MYVTELSITNLRCFRQGRVEFTFPGKSDHDHPNLNLLLGANGAGKTTILKGIALAILQPILGESGFRPYYLVRRGPRKGNAKVSAKVLFHTSERKDFPAGPFEHLFVTQITHQGDYEKLQGLPVDGGPLLELFQDESPAFFLVGYGTTRRVERADPLTDLSRKARGQRYQRVAGLFEDFINLMPLGAWLPALKGKNKNRFEEVQALINGLLPEGTRLRDEFDGAEAQFVHRKTKLPFGALSDGYRAFVGWLGDLLFHLHACAPPRAKLTSMEGVVMVDDVDLLLHPSWQRQLVSGLSLAFPKLQFILTTHSPIVAGTLHRENIFVVREEPAGDSSVRQLDEPVFGLNADQVLTSSYFDLPTTRAPEAVRDLKRLAQEVKQDHDPRKAIAFLRRLAGKAGNGSP